MKFTLRTAIGESFYQEQKEAGNLRPLSEEPAIKDFKYWKIIENRFPYDLAFATHHLLIIKRNEGRREYLKGVEVLELNRIMQHVEMNYDVVMENMPHRRTVPEVYHLHLGVFQKERA